VSDDKPKTVEDLGELSDGIYITLSIGSGEYLGHELSLSTTVKGEPIVYANGQSFRLLWEDIIWIAERRGMFETPCGHEPATNNDCRHCGVDLDPRGDGE